ncbi:unnamed protein product [Cyclocybe aegerita]|uniref:F-box domain-containing protein n=1 Tax=Cyclocybe aegerita TaxID=1973307 RepID=A0A8S0W620_CYCAE|nr:unnamed protein product [Cyclocybe aegerita]
MNTTPWKLGIVCKSWRDIFWSTPQLWTSVTINTSRVSEQGYTEFVQRWLFRSGGLPLFLTLGEGDYPRQRYIPEESAVETALYAILNESSPRWSRLNVCVSDQQLKYLSKFPSCLPSLLDLHFKRFSRSKKALVFGGHMKPSPSKIAIRGVKFQDIGIAWDHVTHVEAAKFQVADCLETFRQAKQMTHFTVHSFRNADPSSELFPEAIVHQRLQVLNIRTKYDAQNGLLDSLTLPSLQDLCCSGQITKASLITRSGCKITRLDLRKSFSQPTDFEIQLLDLLERLPSVTHLTLDYPAISNAFFERLSSSTAPSAGVEAGKMVEFLPDLCSFHMCCTLRFQWECLADILPSHPGLFELTSENPRRALQSLRLQIVQEDETDSDDDSTWRFRSIPDHVIMRLLEVRAGGLEISIMNDCRRDLLRISTHSNQANVG